MEIMHVEAHQPVGAIFPLCRDVHVLRDGQTIERMLVTEHRVTYGKTQRVVVKNASYYEVALFSTAIETKPLATLSVCPVVMMTNDKRSLRYHILKPGVGKPWMVGPKATTDVSKV